MSGQQAASDHFQEALAWQWRTLDVCVGATIDRTAAGFAQYMALETRQGARRVCWNSVIAPHNFEGFFLNMGDMLVKSGDWRTARAIYANAKLSATYQQSPYRAVLEDRIRDAPDNTAAFNTTPDAATPIGKQILSGSAISCVACHQE